MRRITITAIVLVVLVSLVSGCQSYTETGSRSSGRQGPNGGDVQVQIGSANGSASRDIEVDGGDGLILESEMTLAVGEGSFTIELLGEDDEVTLSLTANGGQTVSGQGYMVVDTFGEASYRVSATEAKDVAYSIVYTFR